MRLQDTENDDVRGNAQRQGKDRGDGERRRTAHLAKGEVQRPAGYRSSTRHRRSSRHLLFHLFAAAEFTLRHAQRLLVRVSRRSYSAVNS